MTSVADERPPAEVRNRTLGSATRALQLLEAVAEHRTSVRPPVLAAQLNWSRATLHQHLHTFRAAGWLDQLEDGSYRLGLRASWVGRAAMEQAGLGERILPVMQEITDRVNEGSFLAMLDQDSAFVVERVHPNRRVLADIGENARWPLDSSASGRVLTAFAEPDVLADLERRAVPLPHRSILAQVRRESYAVSADVPDDVDDITAVAIPVRDERGRCVAALGVIGPGYRMDTATALDALTKALRTLDAMWRPGGSE